MKIRISASVEEKKQILPLLQQKFEKTNGDILKKILKDNKKSFLEDMQNIGGIAYDFTTSSDYCGGPINVHDSWKKWFEKNWTRIDGDERE
jgi:hypothetical protein